MGLTNFPNGVSSFGIPVIGSGGVPATKGNVFFVDYGSGNDNNKGKSPARAFKTLAYAYTQCVTNNFDVICLIGSTTHTLTSMLTVAINRLTIIGLDGSPGRRYGQAAKVTIGTTTDALDIGAIKNTGVRNVFQNIKFSSSNAKTEGLYTVVEAGEYAQYNNCEMYLSSQLTVTGAAELACNGDSAEFNNCFIGSTIALLSTAVIRACVNLSQELGGTGKNAVDVSFRNCIFARKAGHVNNNFVYGAEAKSVKRMLLFEDCTFWNNILGSTMAEAIEFGADLTDGSVLLKNCVALNVTGIASTGQGVYGTAPAASATGNLAVAQT